jgi:hypothetical protein
LLLAARPPSPENLLRCGAEIAYLFARLETSGCDFYRNGSWYGSREAAAHLRRKYRYLLEKGVVSSAEEFIERAASKSSSSGKPYQVRCGGGKIIESGPWLRAELMKYRKSRKCPGRFRIVRAPGRGSSRHCKRVPVVGVEKACFLIKKSSSSCRPTTRQRP